MNKGTIGVCDHCGENRNLHTDRVCRSCFRKAHQRGRTKRPPLVAGRSTEDRDTVTSRVEIYRRQLERGGKIDYEAAQRGS